MRTTAGAALGSLVLAGAVTGCGWSGPPLSVAAGSLEVDGGPVTLAQRGNLTLIGMSVWPGRGPVGLGLSVADAEGTGGILAAEVRGGLGLPLCVRDEFLAGVGLIGTAGVWSWDEAPGKSGVLTGLSVALVLGADCARFPREGPGFEHRRLRAVIVEHGATWLNDAAGDEDAELRGWRLTYVHEF